METDEDVHLCNFISKALYLYTNGKYGFDVNTKPTYSTYWNQFTEEESKAPYDPNVHYLVGVKKHGGTLNYLNYIN